MSVRVAHYQASSTPGPRGFQMVAVVDLEGTSESGFAFFVVELVFTSGFEVAVVKAEVTSESGVDDGFPAAGTTFFIACKNVARFLARVAA
jgi:hypothetical protein